MPLNDADRREIRLMIQDHYLEKVLPLHQENQTKLTNISRTQALWSGGLAVLMFLSPYIAHWLGFK
jgi:hypothetical protein